MPQNVRIEGAPVETTIEARNMQHGKAYILHESGPTGWEAGQVVFRAGENFIAVGQRDLMEVHDAIRVREFRPGEKATIQGS